jgi:diguanylate cyclase (GGDEF)-like protein
MKTKEVMDDIKDPKVIDKKSEKNKKEWWKEKALTDPLTKLPNRLAGDLMVKELKKDIKAMAIFDLDHFKKVNDAYGHQMGDEVLQKVASYLDDKLIAQRWGGEEFTCFLVGDFNSDQDIEDYLNKIREGISQLKFSNKEVKVTVTIGYIKFETKEDIDKMFSKIDKALYCGKENGRNQVVQYDSEMEDGICPEHKMDENGNLVKNDSCEEPIQGMEKYWYNKAYSFKINKKDLSNFHDGRITEDEFRDEDNMLKTEKDPDKKMFIEETIADAGSRNIKCAGYKGIGIYWSWDRDSAECHWGKGDEREGYGEIMLIGRVTEDSINYEQTLYQNMSSDWTEAEITLNSNAKVEIIGAEKQGVYKFETIMFDKHIVVKASQEDIINNFTELYNNEDFFKKWRKRNDNEWSDLLEEEENKIEEKLGRELTEKERDEVKAKVDKIEYKQAWEKFARKFKRNFTEVYRCIKVKDPKIFIQQLQEGKLPYTLKGAEKPPKKDTKKYWKEMALYDNLTELPNRNAFDLTIEDQKDEFGFIGIFDIDHFKKINDEYGHDAGDKALVTLANFLMHKILVFRWGGEEFVFLMPKDKPEVVEELLNDIREEVKTITFEEGFNISVSVGFAPYDQHQDVDEQFKLADKALYCAKDCGRDLVTMYEPEMEEGICPAHKVDEDGNLVKNDQCGKEEK